MYYRKVIRIAAEDSPNVELGLLQRTAGEEPTDEMVVDGVLSFKEYLNRRANWDARKQAIGLDARFWRGKDMMLFPEDALRRAAILADQLRGKKRRPKAMGIDSAEGGDSSVWTVVDELGVIKQVSLKTADTHTIPAFTKELGQRHDVPPERWVFDAGGGGKQHGDRLRSEGFDVQIVGFGESAIAEMADEGNVEKRQEYPNRRSQMYGMLARLMEVEFAIPAEYSELRRQLSKIPKTFDSKDRLCLIPKRGKPGQRSLIQLLGCSPDEADSCVLGVYGMLMESTQAEVDVAVF